MKQNCVASAYHLNPTGPKDTPMSDQLTSGPDQVRTQFLGLGTQEELATLLNLDYDWLVHHIFELPLSQQYKRFHVRKRSGETRTIRAPYKELKSIQHALNNVLQQVYRAKPSVHGFVLERSIVTNARFHLKRRNVFNVDLKDFFPSINFGRIRGMFMAKPYNLDPTVATMLARICCYDNQLPQGAPTSPTVSNMLCAKWTANYSVSLRVTDVFIRDMQTI
jgi:RNA-directed DNA polymerase